MTEKIAADDITIGIDPEFFVTEEGDGKSAHELVPGTKAKPFRVDGGAIQVDGLALEFNVHPSKTADEFIENIDKVLGELRRRVPEKYAFAFQPTMYFNKVHFEGLPPEVKQIGCDPDFNAYSGEVNVAQAAILDAQFCRTASGHIHVGWTKDRDPMDDEHFEECRFVVKQLDAVVGNTLRSWEPDNIRTSIYGRHGTFRPKPYGVEWRSPSNVYLRSKALIRWVFNTTKRSMVDLLDGKAYFMANPIAPSKSWAKPFIPVEISKEGVRVWGEVNRDLSRNMNKTLFGYTTVGA